MGEFRQTFKYFAVKPIKAEHPVGSGTVVEYGPGDEFPGSDWGRSVDWLVEAGKAIRVVDNVWDGPKAEEPHPEPIHPEPDPEPAAKPKPRAKRGAKS